jgi:hypothetical protein
MNRSASSLGAALALLGLVVACSSEAAPVKEPATCDAGQCPDTGVATAQDAAPPDPACTPYCACMDSTCRTLKGYPFANVGACLAACGAMTAEERTCYPKWCRLAETTPTTHLCDHAWGRLGTAECDTL